MNRPISALWRSSLVLPVVVTWLAAADAAPDAGGPENKAPGAPDAGSTVDASAARSDAGSSPPETDAGRDVDTTSDPSTATPNSDASPRSESPDSAADDPSPELSVDGPGERLDRAEQAFQNGEFRRITRLLEPALEPTAEFDEEQSRIRARELLGVGFFFVAQRATGDDRRDALMEKSREQFLELLRERPDYELDSLIFPEGAVEVFESVKRDHSDELAEIRAAKQATGGAVSSGGAEPIYIEREVERNLYLWNFVPGGAGQFQNRDTVKGVLLGSGQVAAVGVHAFSVFRIQSVCPGLSCWPRADVERARFWRSVQYFAWGGFGLLYGISVVDALLNYTPREVHIRTRDKPPPELSDSGGPTGNGPKVRIGLGGVQIRW